MPSLNIKLKQHCRVWHVCTTWLKYHPHISYTYTCIHAHTGSPSSTTVTTSVPASTKQKSISTRKPPPKKPTFNEEWRKKRQGQREFMGKEAAAGECMNSNCSYMKLAQSCAVDWFKILIMWFKWQANWEGRGQYTTATGLSVLVSNLIVRSLYSAWTSSHVAC